MRTAVALAALLLSAASASAEPLSVRHSTPGLFDATNSTTAGAQWALLVFDGNPAAFDLQIPQAARLENTSLTIPLHVSSGYNQSVTPPGEWNTTWADLHPNALRIEPRVRSAIYIEATRIELEAGPARGLLDQKKDGDSLTDFHRYKDRPGHLYRAHQPPGNDAVLTLNPDGEAIAFNLRVVGPASVEWFDVAVSCRDAGWCPSGGGPSITHLPSVGTYEVASEHYVWETLHTAESVTGSGELDYAVLGSTALDLTMNGEVRLPLASGEAPCRDCLAPDGQTLLASGDLELTGIHWIDENTLGTSLDGDLRTARLDEQTIDPAILLGVGAAASVAAVALGLLALKVLGILFTKWHDRDILSVARRRLIYEAIQQHPGTGFRELTRLTGMAIGTVRHHLDVLLRHGKIVERPEGPNLRFFENHGKYDRTWSRVAVLRDVRTRAVHDWLAEHPDTPQQQVLAALMEQGLPRTSIQRRLERLVEAGLAAVQQRGRFKVYRAI